MAWLALLPPGLYVAALGAAMYGSLAAWFEQVPRRVIAIHAILVALVLGPQLFLGRTLLPISNLRGCSAFGSLPDSSSEENALRDDLLVQQLPTVSALRGALGRGEFPFRDDSLGGGVPLWADQQAQVLHPPMLVSLVFPPERALVVVSALRMLLALTFSFLFFRAACGSAAGALAGSIAFGLGGFVQLWIGWPLASTAAFLPVVLWGIRRVADSGRRRDAALLITATFGLLTSGHPETVVYALAFSIAYAALAVLVAPAPERRRLALALIAPITIGGALTAPANVPSLRAISTSERAIVMSYQSQIREHDNERPRAEPARVASVLAPDAFGNDRFGKYWGSSNINEDGAGYAGTAAILLGLIALARLRRDRVVAFLLVVLSLCLLVISAAEPFGWLVRHLPVLSSSSSGGHRLLILVCWIVAWLAAIGVAHAEQGATRRLIVCLAALLLAFSLVVIYTTTAHTDIPPVVEARRSTMLVVQLAAIAIATASVCMRSRRVGGALLVVTLAAELAVAHMPATPPASSTVPRAPALLAALRERAEGWRVQASRGALRANLGSIYGIRQIEVYNPIAPAAWLAIVVDIPRRGLVESSRRDAEAWLDALGARYALRARAEVDASVPTVLADGRSVVIERPSAQRQFRFAGGVSAAPKGSLVDLLYLPARERATAIARRVIADRGSRTSWLLSDPPRGDRLFVRDASFWSDEWAPVEGDTIELISRAPSRLSFAANSHGPRLLTTTEVDDGGWTARIDGRLVGTETTNGAFVGVRLPAGSSRVDLRYRPPGLANGVTVGLLGIVTALVVLAAWPRLRTTGAAGQPRDEV